MNSQLDRHLRADLHDVVLNHSSSSSRPSTRAKIIAVAAAGLAVSAFVNHRLAKKAEQDNPPAGNFLTMNGVRLH